MSSMALSSRTIDSFGVNQSVIAQFLFKDNSVPLNYTFKVDGNPINITNYTITFKLQKQIVDTAKDGKNGFECLGRTPDPDFEEMDLDSFVTKTNAAAGKFLVEIPVSVTAIGEDSFGTPSIYSGYITFEDNASVGELIQSIPVLVAVK